MDFKNIVVGIFLVTLVACTNFQRPYSNTLWREQRQWQMFVADGRMSVKVGEKGYPAVFYWLREGGVETFDINTPLGTTVLQLCQDSEGVLAVDQEGKVYQAKTVEQLSEQLLGYPLPVQYLSVWLNGEWVRGVAHHINRDGSLVQGGWQVRREMSEEGKVRILMVENEQAALRMVFNGVEAEEGLPKMNGVCAARQQKL